MKRILVRINLTNGKEVKYYTDKGLRRILARLSLVQFKYGYVKTTYGRGLCNMGCYCEFSNEGEYDNKDDFIHAIKAFWSEV